MKLLIMSASFRCRAKRFSFLFIFFVVLSAIFLNASLLSVAQAATGINPELNYQGVLKDSLGNLVTNGSYDMVFKIYTTSSGGSPLWVGTYTAANSNSVQVSSGFFSVLLGSGTGNSLSGFNFNQDTLYLGISVGSDSEMSPRLRIGSVASAFDAAAVNGLSFSDTSYSPGDILFVNSGGQLQRLAAGSLGSVLSVGGGSVPAWVATSSLGIVGSGGSSQWTTLGQNIFYSLGNVGIGTTSPWATLSVKGNSDLGNSAQAGYFIATSSTASQFPYASSTALTATTLYSNTLCLAGTCKSAWPSGASSTGTWSTTTSSVLGELLNYSNNTSDIVTIGGTATTSAKYWFDPNSQIASLAGSVSVGTLAVSGTATSTFANGINLTHGCFAVNGVCVGSSGGANFWTSAGGNIYNNIGASVGIGTTSPWATLSVNGFSDLGISAQAGYFNATNTNATSTFSGGLNVGNGALTYTAGSGVTSIDNLQIGGLSFASDAGVLTWTDLPVTSASAAGVPESYTADINGDPLLTVYSQSDGLGGIQYSGVGIGTTSPMARFAIAGTTGTTTPDLFTVASSSGSTLFTIGNNGTVGIGTTSPWATLSVNGYSDLGTFAQAGYFNATNTNATSTFSGGLTIGNGAFTYTAGSGVTSIDNLQIGATAFDTNAGIVSWTDLPVTSAAASSTVESYTAQLGGNPLLTVFGLSSGAGGVNSLGVGVGTTSPWALLSVGGQSEADFFTAVNSSATSTFAGGLNVGNGALTYTAGSGVTSISNLQLGNATFDSDAGVLTWIDLPVTSASLAGTRESYSADINGNPLLTMYGESDGAGGVQNLRVSVGTSTVPYSTLQVWGSTNTGSTSAFAVVNSASTTEFAVFDNGNATLAGSLTQNSDQRLKTNVASLDASSTLALMMQLNPISFNWIDPSQGTSQQLGLIAQDVQKIFPNLVAETSPTPLTPGGTLSVNYIGLISPLLKAVQAIENQVVALVNQVALLQTAIANFAQRFQTNELCVGTTCITQQQFAAIIAATGQTPTMSTTTLESTISTGGYTGGGSTTPQGTTTPVGATTSQGSGILLGTSTVLDTDTSASLGTTTAVTTSTSTTPIATTEQTSISVPDATTSASADTTVTAPAPTPDTSTLGAPVPPPVTAGDSSTGN